MNNAATIKIKEITVFGGRNEITVLGTQYRNHLSYESTWHINNHELNRLINELQRLNDHLQIAEIFSTFMSTEGLIMQLDGQKLEVSDVRVGWLADSPLAREIRA